MSEEWIGGDERRTEASFLSSKAVDCAVPRLSVMAFDSEDFLSDLQPYARWEIMVLKLGRTFSSKHANMASVFLWFAVSIEMLFL